MSIEHTESGACSCPICTGHTGAEDQTASAQTRAPQLAPVFNNTQVIGQIDSGAQWGVSQISYGFLQSAPSWSLGYEGNGFSAFTAYQASAARSVIALWDELIAPSFVEQVSSPEYAQVNFGNSSTYVSYAHAYYPGTYSWAGEVWLNAPTYQDLYYPDPGDYYFMTILHEVGHALGLSHPGTYNGGSPTYQNDAVYAQDTHQWTVMSYFSASNTGADWNGGSGWKYAQTPMVHDVLTIQTKYGADPTTRTGDTTYGFNSNAGSALFDFSQNSSPVLTIYDAGGNDTLDLSGFSQRAIINLEPGTYSSAGGTSSSMTYNIGIANGTWIENAVGGSGNDTLYGNSQSNNLFGSGGNDHLYGRGGSNQLSGGSGTDWVHLALDMASYTFNVLSNLIEVIATYIDTVFDDVEWLAFSDTNISYADLATQAAPPTFTAGDDVTSLPFSGGTFDALGGNDVLSYAGGFVTADGNAGTDTFDFAGFGSAVWVSLTYAGDEAWTRAAGHLNSGPWRAIANLAGFENITGTNFDDNFMGDAGANTLTGGGGNDLLQGGGGDDILNGGAGTDTAVFSGTFASYAFATSGTDIMVTGEGTDTVRDDVERFQFADTTMDRAALIAAMTAPTFSEGDDTVTLPSSGGTFSALGGADVLSYAGGFVTMNGGAGTDTFDFSGFGSAVWVDLAFSGSEAWTRDAANLASGAWRAIADLANVENVTGTNADDNLMGNAGANTLAGGAGNDLLNGRGGDDIIDGGAGTDTAVFSGAFASYAFATSGTDVVVTGEGTDTVRDNVELFRFSDATIARATLIASMSGPAFTGDDDTITLPGAGGTFDALGGNDTATYAGGLVTMNGGAGSDTFDFSGFGAAVWVDLAFSGSEAWTRDTVNLAGGTWRAIADLSSVENIVGTGFDDRLMGDTGANTFGYTGGYDVIDGRTGNDTFDASGFGSAIWADLAFSGDEIWTRDGSDLASGVWRKIAKFAEIENLVGTDFDDRLYGNAGNNVLEGGAGNDLLTGRAGDDTFVFTDGGGVDTIADFEGGPGAGDLIDISAFGYANLTELLAGSTDVGADVHIQLDEDDAVIVANTQKADFASDDFLFS